MIKMIIANWFLYKNFTQNERLVIEQDDYTIISETEKALWKCNYLVTKISSFL